MLWHYVSYIKKRINLSLFLLLEEIADSDDIRRLSIYRCWLFHSRSIRKGLVIVIIFTIPIALPVSVCICMCLSVELICEDDFCYYQDSASVYMYTFITIDLATVIHLYKNGSRWLSSISKKNKDGDFVVTASQGG